MGQGPEASNPDFKAWIGRTETHRDVITPWLIGAFRATVGAEGGGEVPLGAHWCLAPLAVPMAEIGEDGHPAKGGFLPAVPLPRRMWAGGRLTFHAPLGLGDTIERRSTIKDVTIKEGRTGTLCFVVVAHEIHAPRGLAISEEQDIVYRGMSAGPAGPAARDEASVAAEIAREIEPSPVLLFRYSALTFNGHRIHYDRPYAMAEEGYPGLVVHGPLQASMLLDLARRMRPGQPLKRFAFRAVSPLFDLAPFTLKGRLDERGDAALWVADPDGGTHMRAEASWGG
jgi:3-methylfumaryl-CoA hydratase